MTTTAVAPPAAAAAAVAAATMAECCEMVVGVVDALPLPPAADGCEPSSRPWNSFCDRPDTSRGVVCPFNLLLPPVGVLQRNRKRKEEIRK